jgi:succinyl-diaminopimelate desuccinylase
MDTFELTRLLVERPSITPNDAGCQDFIRLKLSELGFEIYDYSEGGTTNTWAKKRFSEGPMVMFAGHTDVVAPGNSDDWIAQGQRLDPFALTEIGNTCYGRGIADMKGGIAAMLTAADEILTQNSNNQLTGALGFLITSDEEGDGTFGTKIVAEKLKETGEVVDYCIVGEASSIHNTGDRIYIGRRGSFDLDKLIVHGIQGHVAKRNGINALEVAARLVAAAYDTTWEDAPHPDFEPTSVEFTELLSSSRAFDSHGSQISAGDNVVPSAANLRANWRYNPNTTPDKIQAKLLELAEREYRTASKEMHTLDDQFQATWTVNGEPYSTPQSSTIVQAARQSILATVGRHPELSTSGGTSDGRFIAPILGARVVEVGLPGQSIHATNEHVPTQSLFELHSIYAAMLRQLLLRK